MKRSSSTVLNLIIFISLAITFSSATRAGTITFENVAAWPDSGEVQVTIWGENVWSAFGPVGPPAGVVTLTKVSGQTQYEFSFEGISAGSYSAISAGWGGLLLEPHQRRVVW